MGTILLGPAMPLGYDDGLSFLQRSPSPPLLEELLEMTTGKFSGHAESSEDQMMYDFVHLNPIVESSNVQGQSSVLTGSTAAASDQYTLPARGTVASHHQSNQSTERAILESISAGSSRSPGNSSQILTPASTFLDYNASLSDSNFPDEEDTDENLSPTSDSDYVHVPYAHLHPRTSRYGPQTSHMSSNRHVPSSSQGSGASDAQQPSRASSVAPSTVDFSGAQWGSVYATGGPFMDNQHTHPALGNNSAYYVPATYTQVENAFTSAGQTYSDVALSDFTSMDTQMFNAPLPYRPGHDQPMFAPTIYGSSSFPHSYNPQLRNYSQADIYAQRQQQHAEMFAQQARMHDGSRVSFPPQLNIPSTESLLVQPQLNPSTAPLKMEQVRSSPSPMPITQHVARRSIPSVPSHRTSPYPQPSTRPAPPTPSALQLGLQYPLQAPMRQPPSSGSTTSRPLQAARPRPLPSNVPRASAAEQGRKGGRQKGRHLADEAKVKSSKMRKVVACWRCALQRDPCDPGMPCGRCTMRAQKGQTYFFDCDRSKLPDFVHDFLPPTMTLMHQKQTIEDTVADQVLEWDKEHPLGIYLTSGYGPPLQWTVHEFKPRTNDLLGQLQYLQNPATGLYDVSHKYSPPFGLLKLDSNDDEYLKNYLETLLLPEWIWEMGWTFFEEESQVDEDNFQARLLQSMCNLFVATNDHDLREILREILRMMSITYIMGHTLTIVEETLPRVLDAVRYSPKMQIEKFVSPRLANRQLKFYFHVLRTNIYEKVLKWQQQTLHTSGRKEDTWLLSFCAILGFAMVLEEVQRTILLQADAKGKKHEMPWDQATTEARNACERIDERFTLLVGLFQCKYRDKKWSDKGSFGPQTPTFHDGVTNEFLQNVRELLEDKIEHLQTRRDVPFGLKNQCQYTSRLVARFLLPFLNLPHN